MTIPQDILTEIKAEFAGTIGQSWKIEGASWLYVNKVVPLEKQIRSLKILLREVTMRANIAFPENEDDLKWFNEQFKYQPELMVTLFDTIGISEL